MIQLDDILEGYTNLALGINRDVMKVRLQICQRCDYFGKALGTCNQGCKCVMKAKASILNSKCPIKLW